MFNKTKEYMQKVKEQISQYEHTENMHAQLSDIFRYWQVKYFKPRFVEVCDANNHLEFYWKPFAKRIQQTGCRDVISFGCGDAQVEVGVATGLKKEGINDFRFHCVELSPIQITRAREFVEKAGLTENFVFVEADFNTWEPNGQIFAGAMCHHALHHVLDLEHLIAAIRNALHPQGCFVSIDVVGRNGHMRWPEALEIIEQIWRFLPEEKRYHHILKRMDQEYVNRDCSTQGFEGIRSQDILPILNQHFKFEQFFAFGNLVDVFTSRGFGASYDSNDEQDKAFIDFIQYLNDLLIDLGHIKPTRMCAVMVLENEEPTRTYKNWTPEFCIRNPDQSMQLDQLVGGMPRGTATTAMVLENEEPTRIYKNWTPEFYIRNPDQSMQLDLLVGGMPRSGTTVAAKFMSLHQDIFCYAGETHLIPFMHGMFGQLPCRDDKVDLVARFLHQQFMTAMVDMPRFSVSQGAHPGNLIFEEKDVDDLVEAVRSHLKAQLYGADLYKASLGTLRGLLSKTDRRIILGEKTPNNIFAMADYSGVNATKNIVVMREPIGVLRSMKARAEGGDAYSNVFKGDLETNIGMYLEYAMSARQVLNSTEGGLLVRYEDIAQTPATVVREMFKLFGREAEERVIKFVENGRDPEIANRAPMNYRPLNITADYAGLSPVDIWKVFRLTRELREVFGYSDAAMTELGFDVSSEWPDVEVPSTVLPLYGFHQTDGNDSLYMKRRGGLIAYLGKGRSHDITLEFKSKFPEQVQGEVELRVSVNGIQREVLKVNTGSQSTVVNVKVHSDELIPMGNRGGYAVIDLLSSVAYSQIGHTVNGNDAREISFQLSSWTIDKKPF